MNSASQILLKDRILSFYFGLAREDPYESVEKPLTDLLSIIKMNIVKDGWNKSDLFVHSLRILYLIIGHTRDIYLGRGERDLAYHMIYVWYQFFPVLAIYALHQFFHGEEDMYGSTKDLVYFPHYIRRFPKSGTSLIEICTKQVNRRVKSNPNSVIQWIPSENSSKGWIFDLLAMNWFGVDCFTNVPLRFMSKMLMNYRKEINSCKNGICNYGIQNPPFLCKNKDLGKYVRIIAESKRENALSQEKDILWINKKWENILYEYSSIEIIPAIPLVDISIEMSDYELHSAIGIACLIAYKSGIHRILLMSHLPLLIAVDDSMDFISMVLKILSECKERSLCNYQSAISMVENSRLCTNFDVSIILLSNFHFLKRKFRENLRSNIKFIFWNIGVSCKNILPLCNSEIVFVSGRALSVLRLLHPMYLNVDSYSFLCRIMEDDRYYKLNDYFQCLVNERNRLSS
jgi:hypothetical protein